MLEGLFLCQFNHNGDGNHWIMICSNAVFLLLHKLSSVWDCFLRFRFNLISFCLQLIKFTRRQRISMRGAMLIVTEHFSRWKN
jgi:hypothetical protein